VAFAGIILAVIPMLMGVMPSKANFSYVIMHVEATAGFCSCGLILMMMAVVIFRKWA